MKYQKKHEMTAYLLTQVENGKLASSCITSCGPMTVSRMLDGSVLACVMSVTRDTFEEARREILDWLNKDENKYVGAEQIRKVFVR